MVGVHLLQACFEWHSCLIQMRLDFGVLNWCWNKFQLLRLLAWNECLLCVRKITLGAMAGIQWFECVPQIYVLGT